MAPECDGAGVCKSSSAFNTGFLRIAEVVKSPLLSWREPAPHHLRISPRQIEFGVVCWRAQRAAHASNCKLDGDCVFA